MVVVIYAEKESKGKAIEYKLWPEAIICKSSPHIAVANFAEPQNADVRR
jgi:hypothetical protein